MDNTDLIAITEAESAAKGKETLEERLEAAMNATKDHWLLTDEDRRFMAAVGGVLLVSNEEEQERIKSEVSILKTISAGCSGVPIKIEELLKQSRTEPIGMMKMWKKIKGE